MGFSSLIKSGNQPFISGYIQERNEGIFADQIREPSHYFKLHIRNKKENNKKLSWKSGNASFLFNFLPSSLICLPSYFIFLQGRCRRSCHDPEGSNRGRVRVIEHRGDLEALHIQDATGYEAAACLGNVYTIDKGAAS
ncbi:hypothetical protein Dsin_032063 [Dipteronia sinensis]|uniref:Uncharacterized protein n=1 Tax=Dipteronia sinensis TaxID=43782 RepID=A0AAD9ZMV0_9ROSI|nr:hypothetical protein Dsin_032063 [Dipteronia sinensis]